MTKVTRCSCWHQNFNPKGLSAPALGLYTCIKSWKKIVWNQTSKRFFFKLVANDGSDERFLLTSKFCPLGLSAPDLQLYTFIKSWKDMYKVTDWRFFLSLQQMTMVIRPSSWYQNFGPNGLSAPTLGLCLNFFSSITTDFNISSAFRWAIQDEWSSGFIMWLYLKSKILLNGRTPQNSMYTGGQCHRLCRSGVLIQWCRNTCIRAIRNIHWGLFELRHDKTNKISVRPAKTQIRLGECPVWSESSLCAWWVAKDPSFLHADSEDSDQTGADLSLRWAHTHFVGFVMSQLIS